MAACFGGVSCLLPYKSRPIGHLSGYLVAASADMRTCHCKLRCQAQRSSHVLCLIRKPATHCQPCCQQTSCLLKPVGLLQGCSCKGLSIAGQWLNVWMYAWAWAALPPLRMHFNDHNLVCSSACKPADLGIHVVAVRDFMSHKNPQLQARAAFSLWKLGHTNALYGITAKLSATAPVC